MYIIPDKVIYYFESGRFKVTRDLDNARVNRIKQNAKDGQIFTVSNHNGEVGNFFINPIGDDLWRITDQRGPSSFYTGVSSTRDIMENCHIVGGVIHSELVWVIDLENEKPYLVPIGSKIYNSAKEKSEEYGGKFFNKRGLKYGMKAVLDNGSSAVYVGKLVVYDLTVTDSKRKFSHSLRHVFVSGNTVFTHPAIRVVSVEEDSNPLPLSYYLNKLNTSNDLVLYHTSRTSTYYRVDGGYGAYFSDKELPTKIVIRKNQTPFISKRLSRVPWYIKSHDNGILSYENSYVTCSLNGDDVTLTGDSVIADSIGLYYRHPSFSGGNYYSQPKKSENFEMYSIKYMVGDTIL